jgi:O-antigen ligase
MPGTWSTRWFLGFAAFFLICCIASLLLLQPAVMVVPFVVIGFLWICHEPFLLFYLLVASIPWSIEYNFTETLGTDLPTEPLMLLTSFSVLCFLIYHRRKKPLEGTGRSMLLVFLLLQLAWIGASAWFSTNFVLSLKFFLAKTWYLGAFIVTPLVLFREKKNLVRTAQVLAVSMLILVVRTMFRHAATGFTFGMINNALWPNFRNHVNYSAVLACMVPILVAGFHFAKTKTWKRVMRAAIALSLLAILLSYARGAWLMLLVGGAAFVLLRFRVLMHGFFLAIVVISMGSFWLIENSRYMRFANDYNTTVFHTNFQEHLKATYEFKDVSTAERFYRWIAGVRMIKVHWATGWGPNTYVKNYKDFTIPAFKTWVSGNPEKSTVHNYYLFTVIEQGFGGLFILLVVLCYAFYIAQKIYRRSPDPLWRAAVAVAAVILTMHCAVNFLNDLVETDKLGSIFYLCIATLIAAEIQFRKTSPPAPLRRRGVPPGTFSNYS